MSWARSSQWSEAGDAFVGVIVVVVLLALILCLFLMAFRTLPEVSCRAVEARVQAHEVCRTIEGCEMDQHDVWLHLRDVRTFEESCGGDQEDLTG